MNNDKVIKVLKDKNNVILDERMLKDLEKRKYKLIY